MSLTHLKCILIHADDNINKHNSPGLQGTLLVAEGFEFRSIEFTFSSNFTRLEDILPEPKAENSMDILI